MVEAVKAAIESETKRICEEEANAASARVFERVKGLYGSIATKLITHTNFRYNGSDLIISVRINDKGGE